MLVLLKISVSRYLRKKECALAHSRACGGRLRHLPYTPQCASSQSVFYFTGKQFPVKKKAPSCNKDARLPFLTTLLQHT